MPRGLALAAAMAAAACAGTGARDHAPASTAVEAYLHALEADDPRAAYALLSEREREATSYEAFERAWNETPVERAAAARELEALLTEGGALDERAAVTLEGGTLVHLSREGEAWRLDVPVAAGGLAPTPRDAVAQLAAALTEQSYPKLLRVLTERRRDAIRERVDSLTTGLQAHRDAPLERLSDNQAALEWNDDHARYRIILREEDGEWRVDEVHIFGLAED